MSRDERGRPIASPPVLLDIESDPVLANVKLIAEPWDAAGLYQVGALRRRRLEGVERQIPRRRAPLPQGRSGTVRSLACRILGSPDIYGAQDREPEQSINFVTCHDGFTLNDLVSYDRKHNEANGESNRDGSDVNHSWNCGVEGPTQDLGVEQLRVRQVKNFLALTLFATGTPMLLMGDEIRRTQRGNNNAYCLDDDTTWFDWSAIARMRTFTALSDSSSHSAGAHAAARALRDDVERADRAPSCRVARRRLGRAGLERRLPQPRGDVLLRSTTEWRCT